VTKLRWNQRS